MASTPDASASRYSSYWMQVYSSRSPSPVSIAEEVPIEHQPHISRAERRRSNRASRISAHVNLDYFDPSGFESLRRRASSRISTSGPEGELSYSDGIELHRRSVRLQSGRMNDVHVVALEAMEREESESKPMLVIPSEEALGDVNKDGEGFDIEKSLRATLLNNDARELGVMFKNLRVVGLGASSNFKDTVGSMFNPVNILDGIRKALSPPLRNILDGFEGVVQPGEMLLVLGSPGSGCSTFLKTLANHRKEYHHVEGDVYYDGFTPGEIEKHYRGDVIYCPEDDVHFPSLSVDQTLRFAAKMRTPRNRSSGLTRTQFANEITEVLETIFGLRRSKNTPVGDAAIRGVSGGEKKRVSICEALALRALIGAWDNSTRGLDASTALEFVRALRIATDVTHQTTIVSIYQAGESLYEYFDKVCLIYEGRMAYFGRANEARQYFMGLGFEPANRQTTADFLVSVTDPNARIVREGWESRVPRTASEFAEIFLQSPIANENRKEMSSYLVEFVQPADRKKHYQQSAGAEHAKLLSKRSPYTVSIFMQVRAVMLRRLQILRGNMATEIIKAVSYIINAVIFGTLFFNLADSTSAYFSRGGVIFFSLLFAALADMAEIPSLFVQRPIVLRHYKAAMYHPFIEAAAYTLVDIPITFITLALYSVVIYFLVGLQRTAAQFYIFLLTLFVTAITMKAWFRSVAAAFASPAPAQSVAGLFLLGIVLYTGYVIPRPSMIGALRWMTWINPLRYAFELLITNEFRTLNGSCASLVPSGAGYADTTIANQVCTAPGSLPGQSTVSGPRFLLISYQYDYDFAWRDLGVLLGFGVFFATLLLLFTEFNTATYFENAITLFKRRGLTPLVAEQKRDLEAAQSAYLPRFRQLSTAMPAHDATSSNSAFIWRNLNYEVPIGSGQMRKLLDGVNGYVAPGKLTALMGESGAGKTTLLNVLAQRQTSGVVKGERLVNGHQLPTDFQAQTGYCQQQDTHLAETTVREALLFSAKLRQPSYVPISEKAAYVDMVLEQVGLEEYADAIVGTLNVEFKKRVTIGVELAARPKLLLFLDEPTSGLDSQSAWAIIQVLRELADNGQAVLCTIHQPSAELFEVFDRLLLLRKGGQTVYFGDIGRNSAKLLGYFQQQGGDPCPPEANPAEYILNVIGAGATASSEMDWHQIWKESAEARATDDEIERIVAEGRARGSVGAARKSEFSTNWFYQAKTLLARDLTRHWRDPTYVFAKFALNIVGAVYIGFTFFEAKGTIQGTQNKLFSVFMSTIISVPLGQQILVPYISTRKVYEVRERPSRMYDWTALVTAQLLGELPINVLASSIYFVIWYWLVALPTDRAGFTYLMLGVIFPCYYTTVSLAVASMAPNEAAAALIANFLFTFVVTFNGVLQPFSQLGWWVWMYRVSPYTYLIEGLIGQAVGRATVTCGLSEIVTLIPPVGQTCQQYLSAYVSNAGGSILTPNATDSCQFCPVSSTDEFLLSSFNITYDHRWRDFGFMWIYIGFNVFVMFSATYIFRIRGSNPSSRSS